jgi:hypothetical protein
MTRKQLEEKRDGLEAQMRWAVLHSAGQELLDLSRVENDHLLVTIGPGAHARFSDFITPWIEAWRLERVS